MWNCALPCVRVCSLGKEEWVSRLPPGVLGIGLLLDYRCWSMSSVPTPSSFRAASQGTYSTSLWQLTPFSCMFCGRQSSLLLWHYLLQLTVETVAVLRQTVLHIYRVKMSVWDASWYRMCTLLSFVHVHSVFLHALRLRVVSKDRQPMPQSCCACSLLLLSWAVSFFSLEDDKR